MNNDSVERIYEQAGYLADLVKNSPEYIQLMAAKENLDKDAMNKQVLKDLRDQQMSAQLASISGKEAEAKNRIVNEMYMAVSLNPVISDYLNAEYNFGKIIRELGKIFGEILVEGQAGIGLDFFTEDEVVTTNGFGYLN